MFSRPGLEWGLHLRPGLAPDPRHPVREEVTDVLKIPVTEGTAACVDRLDLVDEAFEHSGQTASAELRKLCRHCEVAPQCLSHAMLYPEFGVWGGTGVKARTQHGAPSAAHRSALHSQRRPA